MKITWLSLASIILLLLAVVDSTTLPEAFDSREATIEGIHNALFSGLISCRDVVSSFISRIEIFNPEINSLISLNPNALTTADDLDRKIAGGNATRTLFCIPILLKDNYDTVDGMNTTGGCLDLAWNKPAVEAAAVQTLRQAGAIILGKTNLHELALEGLSVSSLGGQTINPYDFTRTPGGSSGGTGAAIASSFAVFGTGSDTVNSLRSPASANSLFSVRPTRGLISRSGIIPISFTQDAIGPIARNVKDLAAALSVMASIGYDPDDNTTALRPPELDTNYVEAVLGGCMRGLRLGLLQGFFNRTSSSETTPVNAAMDQMVAVLQKAGAIVVPINETVYNATSIGSLDVQAYEYRQDMNTYLEMQSLGGSHPSTLNQLYDSRKFLVIPGQYAFVNSALRSSTSSSTYAPTKLGIQNLTTVLRTTFSRNVLDAIIYPEQKNLVVKIGSPSQSGRNGILAALTGFPVVTVPAGFSPPTVDAPIGVPIGMEILGLPWSEGTLLKIASQISTLTHMRRMPTFANMSVEATSYSSVPTITPNTANIPSAYPIGVL